jgi:hypothetical protein
MNYNRRAAGQFGYRPRIPQAHLIATLKSALMRLITDEGVA